MNARFVWVVLAVLFLGLVAVVELGERSAINSLSPDQKSALESYRESIEDVHIGDFVSMRRRVYDPATSVDGEVFETYVVTKTPDLDDKRIWLKGPGPGSNQHMIIKTLCPVSAISAIEESREVKSIIRKSDPGWKEMATWFALQ